MFESFAPIAPFEIIESPIASVGFPVGHLQRNEKYNLSS
jgi:hypothetical protein